MSTKVYATNLLAHPSLVHVSFTEVKPQTPSIPRGPVDGRCVCLAPVASSWLLLHLWYMTLIWPPVVLPQRGLYFSQLTFYMLAFVSTPEEPSRFILDVVIEV